MALTAVWKSGLVGLLAGIFSLSAAEKGTFTTSDLPFLMPPQPALVRFAQDHRIPLEGIQIIAEPVPATPGDWVTALVTLRQGPTLKQWLVYLQIADPTEKERAENPPHEFELSVEANGQVLKYASGPALALDIRTSGPFVAGEKPPADEKRARALISPDFLGLGLDRACRMMSSPLPPAGAASPPAGKLSDEDLHSYAGMFPAFIAFFQAVQNTPGLKEILWDVLELPSAWSILKRGGKVDTGISIGADVAAVEPATWTMPDSMLYRMSVDFSLNQQPALNLLLVVTAPRPPLLTTAGIVGIVARPPGKKDKRMDLRIIAAHRAASSPASPIQPSPTRSPEK